MKEIHCKALAWNPMGGKDWVYGYPIECSDGKFRMLQAHDMSLLHLWQTPDLREIDPHTICMPSGVTVPMAGEDFMCEENRREMVYEGDIVDLHGRKTVVRRRKGHFSCDGSDHHLGTVAFLGSNPRVTGNIYGDWGTHGR